MYSTREWILCNQLFWSQIRAETSGPARWIIPMVKSRTWNVLVVFASAMALLIMAIQAKTNPCCISYVPCHSIGKELRPVSIYPCCPWRTLRNSHAHTKTGYPLHAGLGKGESEEGKASGDSPDDLPTLASIANTLKTLATKDDIMATKDDIKRMSTQIQKLETQVGRTNSMVGILVERCLISRKAESGWDNDGTIT
jgi:hypothetical protein